MGIGEVFSSPRSISLCLAFVIRCRCLLGLTGIINCYNRCRCHGEHDQKNHGGFTALGQLVLKPIAHVRCTWAHNVVSEPVGFDIVLIWKQRFAATCGISAKFYTYIYTWLLEPPLFRLPRRSRGMSTFR